MKGRMAMWIKMALGAMAFVASLAMVVSDADARAGKGGSSGSRGSNTQAAPPATNTAPRTAPIDKSITPGQAAKPAAGAAAAGAATKAAQPSRFGGLMGGLLLGGLMGAAFAGIFGAGALASALGFIVQGLLIGGLIFLVVSFFRNRGKGNQPAVAAAAAGSGSAPADQQQFHRANAANVGASLPELKISDADFGAFEQLLGDIQTAYGQRDIKSLETRTTPEMLSNFARELDDNSKQGVRNEISGGRLLQGDLAEAWREDGGEYATVAMRYEITDAVVKVATGQVISGSRTEPQEVTEVWTFWRPVNGRTDQWELSAIQQTA